MILGYGHLDGSYETTHHGRGAYSQVVRLRRNYWVYSAGLALAWALVFVIRAAIGDQATMDTVLKVFVGFVVGWVSTTIARYVYPPPAKWTKPRP